MNKDLENKLTTYLLEKYNPISIILHGSRANGKERKHSDWDFAIIVDKKTEVEREIIDESNIDVTVLELPFEEENIQGKWLILREDNCKILFDKNLIAKNIIDKVTKYYYTPRVWTSSDMLGHKAWFRSQLDGMIDYQDEHEAFFRKLGELYIRSIQIWFWFVKLGYMPQVYKSIPQIEMGDPEYFKLLKILAGNCSNAEKIEVGEEIYKRIWK